MKSIPITLEEAEAYSLTKRVLAPFEHTDLRPLYPGHEHLYDPKLQVLEFDDCLVSREGFIQLANGKMISDIGYQKDLPRAQENLDRATRNPENVARVDTPVILVGGHNNYYHWHLNWMPRIVLADRFEDLRDVPLLVHAQPSDYVLDSLAEVTGRGSENLKTLTGPVMRLDKVFVPTMFLNPLHAPFALRSYQKQRRQISIEGGRRLYISRAKAPLRRVLNEHEVEKLLGKYGFETILAEDLSYSQQTEIFSQASHVIGAHGAGLTNILFCNPGLAVIELLNEYYTRVYWSLSQAMGSRQYRQLKSSNIRLPEGETDPIQTMKNSDFFVDLEALRREVEIILRA